MRAHTHLQIHAEYNRDNDLYLSHRLVQAYELSQFVRHTSVSADLSILMGDLNLEPVDLGYRLVLANAALSDAWATVTHAVRASQWDAPNLNYDYAA
jgi:sphingomyelin phosphodiesterase 2